MSSIGIVTSKKESYRPQSMHNKEAFKWIQNNNPQAERQPFTERFVTDRKGQIKKRNNSQRHSKGANKSRPASSKRRQSKAKSVQVKRSKELNTSPTKAEMGDNLQNVKVQKSISPKYGPLTLQSLRNPLENYLDKLTKRHDRQRDHSLKRQLHDMQSLWTMILLHIRQSSSQIKGVNTAESYQSGGDGNLAAQLRQDKCQATKKTSVFSPTIVPNCSNKPLTSIIESPIMKAVQPPEDKIPNFQDRFLKNKCQVDYPLLSRYCFLRRRVEGELNRKSR